VAGLRPADSRQLQNIMDSWKLPGTEIIAPVSSRRENVAFRECTQGAILEFINRRPCTLKDLESILGLHANEINKYLATLENDGLIAAVVMDRGVFYKAK
jgi:predicted HTH transcriptional regulator